MKTCIKCMAEKPLSEFGKHARNADGLRTKCRKCNSQDAVAYARRNVEKVSAFQADYYQARKDELKERQRLRYHADKERIAAKKALYRASHPEVARRLNANRRAQKVSAGRLSRGILSFLLASQRGKCANCTAKLAETGHHIDHIQPLSRGGLNVDSNVQLLCPPCNLSKFNADPIHWAQKNGRLL